MDNTNSKQMFEAEQGKEGIKNRKEKDRKNSGKKKKLRTFPIKPGQVKFFFRCHQKRPKSIPRP